MKPFLILLTTFIISIVILKLIKGNYNVVFLARIAISMMLLFTALGHFIFTEGMIKMIPQIIPFKIEIIYCTAIFEILAAISINYSQTRIITAWLLILFFILILPANIKASIEQLNYQTGVYNGNGLKYLWFRIPLQILFIIWVYICSIKYN